MFFGWVIEIAKALTLALLVTSVLLAIEMFTPFSNSKAIGVNLLLRVGGARLMLVGVFQAAFGLLLSRLNVAADATGKLHITFFR